MAPRLLHLPVCASSQGEAPYGRRHAHTRSTCKTCTPHHTTHSPARVQLALYVNRNWRERYINMRAALVEGQVCARAHARAAAQHVPPLPAPVPAPRHGPAAHAWSRPPGRVWGAPACGAEVAAWCLVLCSGSC